MTAQIKIKSYTIDYYFEDDSDISFNIYHDLGNDGVVTFLSGIWNDSVDFIEIKQSILKSQLLDIDNLLSELYSHFKTIHPLQSCNFCGNLSTKPFAKCDICGYAV